MGEAVHDDYAEHQKDYRNFLWSLRLIIAALAALLVLLAVFLVQ